jgi:hypothetical protein
MNKDLFEGKWKQVRDQSKDWWSLINDHDLDRVAKAPVKFDKYVTMLQVKYGYTREQARKEIGIRVAVYEAAHKSMTPTEVEKAPPAKRRARAA